MQISHLTAIVEVAKAGSFRKAAARLHRSQPAVTRTIAQVEEEIGLAIFERSSGGVTLTPAGERIHERALIVLAAVGQLQDEARQARGEQSGTVRISVSPVAGTTLLPNALRRFRRKWPGVQVDVLNLLYPDSLAQLREGLLDLVIGPVPPEKVSEGIDRHELFTLQVVLVCHRDNPHRAARGLADLSGANWLIHGPAEGPSDLFSAGVGGAGAEGGLSVTRCHSLATLLELIRSCDGITFLSEPILRRYAEQFDLVRIPVEDPLPRYAVAILSRRGHTLTPAARDLMRLFTIQADGQRDNLT